MAKRFLKFINTEIENLQQAGLFKQEHPIQLKPRQEIEFSEGVSLLNFSSGDYLGFTSQSDFKDRAQAGLTNYGLGLSSSPHICGTHEVHKELELTLTDFLDTDDTMLFSSGYLAQLGLFESLLGPEDRVFCDAQCDVGIKEGLRLSRAEVHFYRHRDMKDLEDLLMKSKEARFRMIVTDGAFALNGTVAPLLEVGALAESYDALLTLDESHSLGVLGAKGRGAGEHFQIGDQVDLYLGSLSQLVGGSGPGFISGKGPIVGWLKQKSNPYLFSTALAPSQAALGLHLMQTLTEDLAPLEKLHQHIQWVSGQLNQLGFKILSGDPPHPIVSLFMGNAITAQRAIHRLFELGIFVTGHCFPLVPKGVATLNIKLSAAHTQVALKKLVAHLEQIGRELELI